MSGFRPNLQIGSHIWRKYESKRRRRDDGCWEIVGQTRSSWLAQKTGVLASGHEEHIAKAGPLPDVWLITEQEWIDWTWANRHRHAVIMHAEIRLTTVQLRQIAEWTGYKEQ
jgi:hypothetical protein